MDLGPAARRREYTAVLNGKRARVSAPAALLAAAPLPYLPGAGCLLLPQGGLPASRSLAARGRTVEFRYADYQVSAGVHYPASVSVSFDGATRLIIRFTAAQSRAFTDADFGLSAQPTPPAKPGGLPGGVGQSANGGAR